jgi:hypothetical protein
VIGFGLEQESYKKQQQLSCKLCKIQKQAHTVMVFQRRSCEEAYVLRTFDMLREHSFTPPAML